MADIPEDVKKQALSATAAVRSEIDVVALTGEPALPPPTPNPQLSEQVGKRVAEMQRLGYGVDEIHQALTKDDFVRE